MKKKERKIKNKINTIKNDERERREEGRKETMVEERCE